jgi:hypothetical protein
MTPEEVLNFGEREKLENKYQEFKENQEIEEEPKDNSNLIPTEKKINNLIADY